MGRLPKRWVEYQRWYNFLRRKETTSTGPIYLNIEPTNACNLNCRVCSNDGSRKRGMMNLGLFRDIIDQASQSGVRKVALFLGGEPLLHKDLPEMVKYLDYRGLESRIRTNATLLTPEKSEELLDAGLDFLGISFDGDNKKDYEAMREGAEYQQVLNNVFNFLELKKKRGLKKPFVSLQMIKLVDNPRQKVDSGFISQFEGLPLDEISPINPHNWRGEKNDVKQRKRGRYYFPCQFLWAAMSITWDGKSVCCTDLNGRYPLGDINNSSLMELWNGEQVVHHRRLLIEKRYSELELCKECHALWYSTYPRLFILANLPPFEQVKNGYRQLFSRRREYTFDDDRDMREVDA
jgi:MoaA/NifB/PqqE/SkfB family radical SAM enzyme